MGGVDDMQRQPEKRAKDENNNFVFMLVHSERHSIVFQNSKNIYSFKTKSKLKTAFFFTPPQ